jgi:dihydrofolate reductase
VTGVVQIQCSMSVDGFIAGPGDAMDWIFEHVAAGEDSADLMAATGAILAGHRSYEVGRRAGRSETSEPYGGGWSGPQFVLTHDAPEGEDDPHITFLSGDIVDAVRTSLAAACGKNLAVLGADVAAQCLARGLVDELWVYVLPVLLGDGVPLYRSDQAGTIDLEPLSSVSVGTYTSLRYRVLK